MFHSHFTCITAAHIFKLLFCLSVFCGHRQTDRQKSVFSLHSLCRHCVSRICDHFISTQTYVCTSYTNTTYTEYPQLPINRKGHQPYLNPSELTPICGWVQSALVLLAFFSNHSSLVLVLVHLNQQIDSNKSKILQG